jgi:FAD/FMN-containing dehydrogenase
MATTEHASIEQLALEEFGSTLRGELVRPGDASYDERRRVWNASIDRYPALIARCAGVAEVIEPVRFARAHQLLVAVRGGGHSYPGYGVCDGGMYTRFPHCLRRVAAATGRPTEEGRRRVSVALASSA